MNVLVCVMGAINVLTSGPMTVSAQRGTCHHTKHRNVYINIIWICINFVLHDMFYLIYVILLCMSVWKARESLCCIVIKCTDFK